MFEMMKVCYQLTIVALIIASCRAAHNCTSFNDKNHGFGCELRNVVPQGENLEISMMAKDDTNKTENDVVWVQIRDSQFDNLPKGVFEKFSSMEKIMIIASTGFQNLETSYFDKKIKLVLMKNTDLEVIGEKSFEGLNDLKTLSLNYNKVRKVHKLAFRDLVNLEKIEMVFNQIEMLDDDTFVNNVNLKLVLLYNNQLKVISGSLFAKNINIESLQLQNNAISQIEKGFHTNLKSLTRADFSSNACLSENIQLTRFLQWSSHQFKFKDCFSNYALMKGTNEAINTVNTKIENLETKIAGAVERVNNDMSVLEGKLGNSSALEDFKTNLLSFFEADRKQFTKNYQSDLNNITSQVRTEMIAEMEKTVRDGLSETQATMQEKLVSHDFNDFHSEFSGKFTFIYCVLFVIICFGCATTFVIFQKLKIFPMLSYHHNDGRKLIDADV